jgi:hypothetical protein
LQVALAIGIKMPIIRLPNELLLTRCGRNSAVECNLAKVDVEGSIPFARSILFTEGW